MSPVTIVRYTWVLAAAVDPAAADPAPPVVGAAPVAADEVSPPVETSVPEAPSGAGRATARTAATGPAAGTDTAVTGPGRA